MNKWCLPLFLAGLGLLVLFASHSPGQDQPPQEGVEVLAQGPVHEAFAEPTTSRPEAAPLVPKQPPEPIEELPPEQKPEGNDVRWVPGYWAFDDTGNDFLWVSGCWRDFPPGLVWVSGHWQEVQGGWQWAPGFWTNPQQQEVQYVPPPPPSIDTGPSTPAPATDHVYVPGCWVYQQTKYLWRPGFWHAHHPEWSWMRAHYVWSPGGCVFVEGFWDHPLHERGLLFAPLRLTRAIILNRKWSYTPHYCVQPDFLISAMFVGPNRRHYYFGDYSEPRYAKAGYVAWVDYRTTKGSYDPNFNYYRQAFAHDKTWESNLRELYHARGRGDIARPPITLVQQTKVINNITVNKIQNVSVHKNINITNVQNVTVLASITQINKTRVTGLATLGNTYVGKKGVVPPVPFKRETIKLTTVTKQESIQVRTQTTHMREIAVQRQQVEAKILTSGHAPVKYTDVSRPVKLDLPKLAPAKIVVNPNVKSVLKGPPPTQLTLPKHVEHVIPKHEPLRPSLPPKHLPKKEGKQAALPAADATIARHDDGMRPRIDVTPESVGCRLEGISRMCG